MKDFVRDATSEAIILDHGFITEEYNHNIPVGKATEIKIDIRNPQGYKLDLELKGTGADSGKVSIKPSSNGQYAIVTIDNPARLDEFDLTVTGTFSGGRPIREPYKLPKMEARHFEYGFVIHDVFLKDGTKLNTNSKNKYEITKSDDEVWVNFDIHSEASYKIHGSYITPPSSTNIDEKIYDKNSTPKQTALAIPITVKADSGLERTYYIYLDSIVLAVPISYEFDAVYGYAGAQSINIVLTNNGTGAVTVSSITYSGDTSDFDSPPSSPISIPENGSISFAVKANNGLNAGDYTITITINYDGGETEETEVTFTVNKRPLTITGASHTKEYDKTNSAADISNWTFSNYAPEETSSDVFQSGAYAAVYTSVNAGTKTISVTSVNLGGSASANYTVNVPHTLTVSGGITPKQLTWETGGVAEDRPYNGDTSAIVKTPPTLDGVISPDIVDVKQGTVNFTSADPGTNTLTASGWGITGADAGNYYAPASQPAFTGQIEKADGADVSAPELASKTHDTITINAVTAPSNGQTVEYGISASNTEPSSWQTELTFTGLDSVTEYFIFARSKENTNYKAGALSGPLTVTTHGSGFFDITLANLTLLDEPELTLPGGSFRRSYAETLTATMNEAEFSEHKWFVDGVLKQTGGTSFVINALEYSENTSHKLTLTVKDSSGNWYSASISFTVAP